jgi:Na+-transporting methylmalonyl-CoA/oxaloacetate decarboxylase gamma subunit
MFSEAVIANILTSLTIMWQGLLAIFIVIGLIILAVQITSFSVRKIAEMKADIEKKVEESDRY